MSAQLHAALVQANQQEIAVRSARGLLRREVTGDSAKPDRSPRAGRPRRRRSLIAALAPRRA